MSLCLTGRDEKVYGFVIGFLSGDRKVPSLNGLFVLGGNLLPQVIKAIHGILELLPQPTNHRRPGPVGRRPWTAAGQAPGGRVGPVQGLQSDLKKLNRLEGEVDVSVHPLAEVLDLLGLVERLALLVGLLKAGVELLKLIELRLDQVDVLEELLQVVGGGHLDDMVVRRGLR